jgi:signal transduction histidine kinase/CheY-like chemotaxis protein
MQHENWELMGDPEFRKADTLLNLNHFIKNSLPRFTDLRRNLLNKAAVGETEKLLLEYGKEASLNILRAKKGIQTVLKANEESEKKAKLKDQLFYAISHEIRTPLNGVIGLIDLLLKSELDTKQAESLRAIKSACGCMFSVCNDALDLSKLNAGKMIQRKIQFHLHEIVETSIRIFHTRAEEKMIELKLVLEEGIPDLLVGDPYRLNQVLMNLLSNAIKFTLEGRVILKVTRLNDLDKYLTLGFSVTDTGPGIPENRLNNLFEEFAQLRPDSQTSMEGAGLGLCITKKIVEMMGGRIEVNSQEDIGSCFNVILGFEKKPKPVYECESQEKKKEEKMLNGFRILLAEDNQVNQLFGEKVLHNAGAKVSIAGNGVEVFQKVRKEHFDLILMDLRMPFMDGLQAASLIRNQPEPSIHSIPIIALTASSGPEVINKCMAAGINAYLLKPFSAEVLLDRILSMFPKPLSSSNTESTPQF